MFKRILTKLWATKSRSETLAEILAKPFHREGLLGVRADAPPSPEQVISDNDRVVRYATSREYAVWANEAWAYVLDCIDKLADPNTDSRQIDFYRGGLCKTLDALKISYRAMQNKKAAVEISRRNIL